MLYKLYFLLFFISYSVTICRGQIVAPSKNFIKIESSPAHIISQADTVIINMNSIVGDLRIVAPAPFLLSLNGLTHTDTLIIPNSQSNTNIPIFISMLPTQSDKMYRGEIIFQDNNFTLNEKLYVFGSSILATESISFCTWNIKWFGLPAQCGCDTAVARTNVTKALQEINADVIALQEIVDISTLQKVVADLGPQYDYVVADYGSQISNASMSGWATCQKMAYIFNKNRITNTGSFGLLRSTYPAQQSTNSAYYYFASGRWPLVLKAAISNSTDTLLFINIHAKAFAGVTEHNRRAGAAIRMTDSLQALFPHKKIIVIGDYNDMLEGAISAGFTVSPYNYMLSNNFVGITKPSLFPGQYTYVGNGGKIIDNIVLSNATASQYVSNSTIILKELERSIPNYQSSTTDHLPILSFLKLNNATEVSDFENKKSLQLIQPNGNTLKLILPKVEADKILLQVYSMAGNVLFEKKYTNQTIIEEPLTTLQKGIYLVVVQCRGSKQSLTWLVD